ncbi:MAG: cytochrome c nitrite reductase small subunit [Bacteroidetes bacterium]|nr:MAG: cytochrome c nitrite reductase small subunit [Bacteroidota bacterium]
MNILKSILPHGKWKLPVSIITGVFFGLGFYIIYISNAISYLSDDPKTCINCHVMSSQYASWNHSSHREAANCNDCHVPHNNVFNKYYFKAKDGLRHATIFTMKAEPQVIQIKNEGKKVVKENCIRCHSNLITDSKLLVKTDTYHKFRLERECWDCHRETPHGRVNSLSSSENVITPLLESPVPEWLKKIITK